MAVKAIASITLIRSDDGTDATLYSPTAPSDTTKLWYDTTNNLLKYWNGETWEVVNDYAGDLNDMKQQITTEYNSAINQLKNSLTTLVEEISTTSTANTEAINNLSSQIAQNATSITMATTSIQQITDKIICRHEMFFVNIPPYTHTPKRCKFFFSAKTRRTIRTDTPVYKNTVIICIIHGPRKTNTTGCRLGTSRFSIKRSTTCPKIIGIIIISFCCC